MALALIVAPALWLPAMTRAAEVTDVMDAGRPEDVFDMRLSIDFVQEFRTAIIARERNVQTQRGTGGDNPQYPGSMIDQHEYDWREATNQLNIGGKIGMWHDLEFHFSIPIVLSHKMEANQAEHWRDKYWGGAYDPNHPLGEPYRNGPSLYADELDIRISNKRMEDAYSIAASTHAGYYVIGQTLICGQYLLPGLPSDHLLKITHYHGVRMRTHR